MLFFLSALKSHVDTLCQDNTWMCRVYRKCFRIFSPRMCAHHIFLSFPLLPSLLTTKTSTAKVKVSKVLWSVGDLLVALQHTVLLSLIVPLVLLVLVKIPRKCGKARKCLEEWAAKTQQCQIWWYVYIFFVICTAIATKHISYYYHCYYYYYYRHCYYHCSSIAISVAFTIFSASGLRSSTTWQCSPREG